VHAGEFSRGVFIPESDVAKVYFSLSNLSTWAARDGKFSYNDFYWSIVDIFEAGEGEEILANFNQCVILHPYLPGFLMCR
jgi:hypothetical protein